MRGFSIIPVLVLAALFGCDCGQAPVSSDAADDREPVEDSLADQADAGPCRSHEDCSNGLFCDGEEICVDGLCLPGEAVLCDDANDCTDDACSEEEPGCVFSIRDRDGDGFGDAACGGTDCDDAREDVYPGAPESCEPGQDLDCTGTPDLDDDQDGYADENCPGGDDCDDHDPDTYWKAPEVCQDGKDQDCDGMADGPMLMAPYMKISIYVTDYSMAWTGSEFVIAYYGGTDICFVRIDASGAVTQEETAIAETGYSSHPDAAWTGSEIALVYRRSNSPYTQDLYYTRLSAQGIKIGDETRLTHVDSSTDELHPSMAWTGSVFGLAWHQHTQIYFKEFDLSGADASDEIILNAHADGINPRLAWTGSEYGVVWNGENIYLARVRVTAEEPMAGEVVQVTHLDSGYMPAPAFPVWTGSEFGIVWRDRRVEDSYGQVYFTRLDSHGDKQGEDIMLSDPMVASRNPKMAWTGSEYGVLWVHEALDDLIFHRLGPAGEAIGRAVRLTAASSGEYSPLDMVWTGRVFGAVWVWTPSDFRIGTYFNRIELCD